MEGYQLRGGRETMWGKVQVLRSVIGRGGNWYKIDGEVKNSIRNGKAKKLV